MEVWWFPILLYVIFGSSSNWNNLFIHGWPSGIQVTAQGPEIRGVGFFRKAFAGAGSSNKNAAATRLRDENLCATWMRLRSFCGANLNWLMFEPKSHKKNRSKCWCRTSEIGDRSDEWMCPPIAPPNSKLKLNHGDNFHRPPCVFSKDNFFVTKIQWVGRGILPLPHLEAQELPKSWWQCLDLWFFCCENCNVWIFFAALLTKQSRKVYIYLEPEISIL